ncbi:MAG: ATP-binding protein [Candidatus Thiodiazotropha sp.]
MRLTPNERNYLIKIMGVVIGRHLMMISQLLATDQWYSCIGENTLVETALDRLVHYAHTFILKGERYKRPSTVDRR